MRHHFACSFEIEDMGYCGKLSGVRESGLSESTGEGGGRVSVLENGGEHWSTSSK